MTIILIRHFKVNHKWKMFYNSMEFEEAYAQYDNATIAGSGLRINTHDTIISSTLSRTIETSMLIFGRAPDFSYDSLCEIPIKPFITTKRRLPKILWNAVGRIHWLLGFKTQPESYATSTYRINSFIDKLLADNENVIIVSHGWTIKLIIKHLLKSGFRGPRPLIVETGVPLEFIRNN